MCPTGGTGETGETGETKRTADSLWLFNALGWCESGADALILTFSGHAAWRGLTLETRNSYAIYGKTHVVVQVSLSDVNDQSDDHSSRNGI